MKPQHINCRCTTQPLTMEEAAFTPKELQAHIRELLDWSEEELAHFIFESGLDYLEAYFGKDTEAIGILQTRKEFWQWFKNHWTYRDQVFCEHFLSDDLFPLSFRRQLYCDYNNAKRLACEIYPSRTVLGNDFSIIKIQLPC